MREVLDQSLILSRDNTIIFHIFNYVPVRLSTLKYFTFLILGIASLWPWNCFLSASDYFQDRFSKYPLLSNNYSSSMMTISTLTSVLFNLYLNKIQNFINYSLIIKIGNYLQMIIFIILTLSIILYPIDWVISYFIFIMINILITSIGSCLTQVGIMALVNMQLPIFVNATVVGNAISGVLPSISMILAVISNDKISLTSSSNKDEIKINIEDRQLDAIKYFITSILIALFAQLLFYIMEYYEKRIYIPDDFFHETDNNEIMDTTTDEYLELRLDQITKPDDEFITFKQLWKKLKFVELTIIITFSITLIFPVFASNIESTNNISKKLFVPLAFLIWNIGDLIGRLLCAIKLFIIEKNNYLMIYSILRLLFIPLFLYSNIKNRGYIFNDFGYLFIQLMFGITNGQLFSSAYMNVGQLLDTDVEKKAAASFTAFLINVSLLLGSLLSFIVVYYCL